MERTLSYEQKMEKAWRLINELCITEDREEYERDPDSFYLVDDIYKVRDAFYNDLEARVEKEDEDVPGFFTRHGIEWQ